MAGYLRIGPRAAFLGKTLDSKVPLSIQIKINGYFELFEQPGGPAGGREGVPCNGLGSIFYFYYCKVSVGIDQDILLMKIMKTRHLVWYVILNGAKSDLKPYFNTVNKVREISLVL